MSEKRSVRRWVLLGLVLLAAAGGLFTVNFLKERWVGETSSFPQTVTTEALEIPDAGFYYIHGFRLTDDMDPAAAVAESYAWDTDTPLTLVQINLAAYRAGAISDRGLENLSALLDALGRTGKQCILRFVYDWDGKNMEVEPESRDIIENHMAQTAPAVNGHKEMIFTLQGLFVGNWGEMNGTRYVGAEHWRGLFRQLASVTDPDVLLAVRMPSQWRQAVSYHDSLSATLASDPQAARLGLFNDGMLGSASDLGTYAAPETEEITELGPWHREEELAFQQELCRRVPNGGEVVNDTEFNDFPAAVEALARMHVSYLNQDYDRRALDKWAAAVVEEPGPWQGMDGLTYIRRHLGCRYAVTGADLKWDFFRGAVQVRATVTNDGFAPAYRELEALLVLEGPDGARQELPLAGDLRALSGSGETLTLERELPSRELAPGAYRVWLQVRWKATGEALPLANEGWTSTQGIEIGRIEPK